MQSQALQECWDQHRQHLKDNNNSQTGVASVSAAPLVAILDTYTASTALDKGARYATLAAVVGVVTSRGSPTLHLDTDDNQSFMESLFASSSSAEDDIRQVRLMAVGRAVLTDFHYQVPLAVQRERMDEEGNLLLDPIRTQQFEALLLQKEQEEECIVDDDADDDDEYHDCDTTDRIVMARFRLYTDTPETSSPVHALAESSRGVSRIHLLHEERKQLVARLLRARAAQKQENPDDEWLWEDDHDGLGDLFASKRAEAEAAEKRQVPSTTTGEKDSGSKTGRMMDRDFGLGTTAASVSTLAAVTATVQKKLQPYYSPTMHASEEHFYELYSFVAVQALSSGYYLGPSHVAWAVREHRTADRLRAVQEWMSSHVEWLKGQLKDCEGATEGDGPQLN